MIKNLLHIGRAMPSPCLATATLSARHVGHRVAAARRLRHVLPIRTAGLLAILDAAPSTDLLFLNHVGVHDFRSLGDLWRNVPFPVPLRFHATRSARNEVPDADTLVDWRDARWEDFDTWVATNTPEPSGSATGS